MATWYSAIGKQRLISLAQDGHIKGFQDPDSGRGDWIFDRLSIDAYREARDPPFVNKKFVHNLMRKMAY